MSAAWNFFSAGQILYGRGAVGRLGDWLRTRGLVRALVVSDRRLVESGVVQVVTESLQGSQVNYQVFDGGQPEPAVEVAVRATELARSYQPDVVVGLGGGSNMDVAKITAVLFTHGGEPSDYFGFDRVPGPVMPLVCLPTTAGTGSEVSHAAVLTDLQNATKVSTLSQYLRPRLALVDPQLTDSCPPRVTADAGIDALTHAIEAFTARPWQEVSRQGAEPVGYDGSYPLCEALAERAIRTIGRFLHEAVADHRSPEARDAMSEAATLAGLAFSNSGVALVHALEYPLGAAVHCSHGAGNGLLLPHVMRFNLPACPEKFVQIAQWLEPDAGHRDPHEGIAAVERLCRRVGIPERLRDLGVRREQLPEFAYKAAAIRRLRRVNPRDATYQDILSIYEAAY
ncbi:MAG: alcohol dehydrogenase [Pirellulaceae bacterium]|nr:MAG: alcohol dehydrogenase [Pirellulaceae bacterium]